MFDIVIRNNGSVPATGVRLLDNYDFPSIRPTQATNGWQPVSPGNDLLWTLATLAPGQIIRYQVETQCEMPGARVCNRATLTCNEGVRSDAEACVEITGRQSTLTIDIQDRTDPAPVGNEVAYDIIVRNLSNVSERNVAVSVELPAQMTPGSAHSGPTQYVVNNRTIQFQPLAELRPGEAQSFRVMGIARERGTATARATAASQAQQTPISATTSTNVF
ncbi:MAG: hypothetical protein QM775_18830 [Pirellulales bacterium]